MMTYKQILKKVKKRKINGEQALESLAEIGFSPILFNDDNGHWAISFDGMQNIPYGNDPEDIATTCFIEKDKWKPSIYEAIIHALESEDGK